MDRLKFRLWDKDIGNYFEKPYIFINTDGKLVSDDCVNVYEIDPKAYIVEKCTGLKDKNGKLIYEGDIVEVSEAYENGIYKIEFCQSDCEYNLYNKEGNFIYQLTKSMARYMKVIGNIHENKELLDE